MTREKLMAAIDRIIQRLLYANRELARENDDAAADEIESAAAELSETLRDLRGEDPPA